MGVFYTGCIVSNHVHRKRTTEVPKLLVDTGSECTWIKGETLESIGVVPEKKDIEFLMANGKAITRKCGFAIIRIGEYFTIDEVVFAESGDLELLCVRTLDGLGLIPDPRKKKLVASGPHIAAQTRKS